MTANTGQWHSKSMSPSSDISTMHDASGCLLKYGSKELLANWFSNALASSSWRKILWWGLKFIWSCFSEMLDRVRKRLKTEPKEEPLSTFMSERTAERVESLWELASPIYLDFCFLLPGAAVSLWVQKEAESRSSTTEEGTENGQGRHYDIHHGRGRGAGWHIEGLRHPAGL